MSFESVGLSALRAAQIGLSTAGHNIANASTPGYHRQGLIQSNAFALKTGAGFIGQGVNVDTVRRQISSYIETQLKQVQTTGAQLDSYLSQISPIDNALGGVNSGLATSLQDFFKGVASVSSNPASVPSRQALLSDGNALVSKFQSLATRFSEVRDGLDTQIADSVQLINSYATQIANLNNQIALQSAGNPNQLPNDLMDQREELISKLNKEVGTSVIIQSDGSASVFFGSGQPLVVRDTTFTLTAAAGKADPQHLEVDYQLSAIVKIPIGSNNISGGTLGGLLAFRDQTLDPAENSLGRIAIVVASAFNDQHALGQDLAGNAGGKFFTVTPGNVIANTANVGVGVLTTALANPQHLTTSDYRLDITAGLNGTLTRLSDNTQTVLTNAQLTAGVTVDGTTLTLGAGAVVGDSYLVRPTRTGASSIALSSSINTTTIAAASPITTLATLGNFGNGTISGGSVNSPNDKVTLTFTGAGTFTATDNTTGAPLINTATGTTSFAYVSGSNISFNGWTAVISGAAVVGDTFQVDKGVTSKTASGGGSTAAINNAVISVTPLNVNLKQNVSVTFSNVTLAGTAASAAVPAAGATVALTVANISAAASGAGAIITAATGAALRPATAAQAQAAGAAIIAAAQAASTVAGATPASVTAAAQTAAAAAFLEYTVAGTGVPAGQTYAYDTTTGASLSYNGWSAKITATPNSADTFTVGPNTNGTADNRNALVLAQLEALSTMNGGTSSFQGSYAQMVSLVGNKTSEIKVTGAAQKELVIQTQAAQQSISGVNLDEEAADLLRFQQAYQAAGKMFEISSTLFNSILSAVHG